MVRSYRKYEPTTSFGTISTTTSNTLWSPSSNTTSSTRSTGAGKAYTAANEAVFAWDIKTGALLSRWHDASSRALVTCLSQCAPQPDLIAAGYSDGAIKIWDALSGQVVVAFNAHRGAVEKLVFDHEGTRLASGGRDTDIIVWNLLSETAEFKLRGHKDMITGLSFVRTPVSRRQSPHTDEAVDVGDSGEDEELEENYLLSTSKDSLVKLWDLVTPHCVETHVAQSGGECWALGVNRDGDAFITAGNDSELKVWSLDLNGLAELSDSASTKGKQEVLKSEGILLRQGKDRTIEVSFHPKQDYVAVHGSEKAVEILRIRTPEEIHRHLQRKRKRRREKAAATGETLPAEAEEETLAPAVGDVFVPYTIIRTGGKVRSVDWASPGSRNNKSLQILAATTNNQLELYTLTSHRALTQSDSKDPPEHTRSLAVELSGHRSDIRTLALSSDDRMLASASSGQLKVWNLRTQTCLRTLDCGQALCSAFLPGDRIVLLGTKTGELELYDISTSTLIESIPAHDSAIWTLAVHPDGKSVVTGSADKSAKFWRFDIVSEEVPGTLRTTQRLKLTQTRILKLSDDILSLCFSPDARLLALSTLDNTVKVFFTDSLKLFLTLYGHKLPVLNISIAADSKLIATCSADKNVRIWGLDFGDCHKAFFAHQDSVMAVSFIPHPIEKEESHHLFSASKDGVLKSWDGDKFEQIQKLDGHHGEIWAMVVSRTGETVVTASHDKSIRVWSVGDDLVFLEEERERELEEMYEATLAANLDRDARDEDGDPNDTSTVAASKQTLSTLTSGEKLLEALDLAFPDLLASQAHAANPASVPPPQRDPVFLALGSPSPESHVLSTLRKIPPASLNDALLILPFAHLPALFTFLALFFRKRMQPELAWRVTYFLLQAHMSQIISSGGLRAELQEILDASGDWVKSQKQVFGFNLAGLEIMGVEAREREVGTGWVDGEEEEEELDLSQGRKKRGFASLA
ncbi:hypothetical protein B0A48_13695 [Cryoendolithus antarcticus]|uniref:Small-subunit processome Utp12 domain-containing protein n=1 Tax=Cryoendolithus antarcticus TaxID=1507870 RepID=A0A1V8SMV0_9PEZI|nr:hypothetical protein B0A48_13695 [Cryoendolithus antarcticus]